MSKKVVPLPKRRRRKPSQAVNVADNIPWNELGHCLVVAELDGEVETWCTPRMTTDDFIDLLLAAEKVAVARSK